jgi:5'-deoxynucleotidase YfbR-like HD superfamily hydrolase
VVEEIFAATFVKASPVDRLMALLHDAAEYVIGDMISPFKSVVGGGYKEVEGRLQRAVHLRFGLPPELAEATRKAIKHADQIAAYFEATELAGFSVTEAVRYFGRPRGIAAGRFDFTPHPVKSVEKAFLKRFGTLEGMRTSTPD